MGYRRLPSKLAFVAVYRTIEGVLTFRKYLNSVACGIAFHIWGTSFPSEIPKFMNPPPVATIKRQEEESDDGDDGDDSGGYGDLN